MVPCPKLPGCQALAQPPGPGAAASEPSCCVVGALHSALTLSHYTAIPVGLDAEASGRGSSSRPCKSFAGVFLRKSGDPFPVLEAVQ